MLFNASVLLYSRARRWFRRTAPRRLLVWVLGNLHPGLTARWAERIFRRTQRYPKPTWEKDLSEKGQALTLPSGNRAHRFGEKAPAVLLVHGWSGRGTQLGYFVEPLREAGFSVVTIDAPGHGESPGESSNLGAYERAVREVGEAFGPFHAVVAHSFGGVASVVAASRGFAVGRFVLLAVPCTIQETFEKFGAELGLPTRAFRRFQALSEERAGIRVAEVHLGRLGHALERPALVVHDPEDKVVPLSQAEAIARVWSGARLYLARGLGHRRLLKDATVIEAAVSFLKS